MSTSLISLTYTYETIHDGVCTMLEVSVMYNSETNQVQRITRVHVMRSKVQREGSTSILGKFEDFSADITQIVLTSLPGFVADINALPWKDIMRGQKEISDSEGKSTPDF